jgi:Antidote-toxin recognition MazE, bacterial antitoxin
MIYIPQEVEGMPKKTVAKLFKNGRSQAVRLPREFRFEGDRVRIRRMGKRGALGTDAGRPRGLVC